jgi:hypothetical protein
MAFSLTATIRAFVAPNHRLRCSSRLWRTIVAELERRGEKRHEAGAFLIGVSDGLGGRGSGSAPEPAGHLFRCGSSSPSSL